MLRIALFKARAQRIPVRRTAVLIVPLCVTLMTPLAAAQPPPTEVEPVASTETRPPKLIRKTEALVPGGISADATVVLEILITETGAVFDARVVTSATPELDAAALEAVRQFVFEPALIQGKPSAVKVQYRYEFQKPVSVEAKTVLRGQVLDRNAGAPLAGVEVQLDSGEKVTTDGEGRFEFEGITPGEHVVTLSGEKLSALQTSETVRAGATVEVKYEVRVAPDAAGGAPPEDFDDLELVIVAPKLTLEVVATRVETRDARRVAGTQGDALKVVENMPGVARASAGSGDVVVWGAAPLDTRVYVDAVRVPALYHFGGFRSVIHSDLVRSVELVPGAYGAPYGRGLGGLVTVETQDPPTDKLHGSLQLDLIDASAAVQAPIGSRFTVGAAVRRCHLGDLAKGQLDARTQEFFPIPRYWDGMARVRYQVAPSTFVEVGGLASSDSITKSAGGDDPVYRRRETRDLAFQRVFVRYRHSDAEGSRSTVVPWIGRDQSAIHALYGSTPITLEVNSTLLGLRASWSGALTENLTLNTGLDIEATLSNVYRRGSTSAPAREGDARVFGQSPADQVNVDRWEASTASAAPYVEGDLALFDKTLHITPGVRFEPYFSHVGRRRPADGIAADVGAFAADLSIQPRLSARWAIGRLTLKAAGGIYRQPPVPEDLSSVFGNPLLGNASSKHLLVGGSVQVTEKTNIEVTAFHSRSEGLAVRNPIPSPRVAEALVGEGKGRASGVQFLIKRELADHLFGWVAYTLLKSERKDSAEAAWRLFDYDQTHVLTALASYELGKGFEIGIRGRVATGYPRTPVVDVYYDARRDQYEPVLGAVNSIRIPTFWQIDARVAKQFKLGPSELEIYLDVQNITNRSNPEEIVYNADYSQRRYIQGLPILPVLGARWSL